MALESMHDLLVHELRDLLNAERQLIKALPKMAKAATNDALVTALENHLEETENQVTRLEECFELLGLAPRGKKCAGMEGLIKEGKDILEECEDEDVCDAAIIGSAQRVEHYEIAAYGTARAFALRLGLSDVAALLTETLDEEAAANELLSHIAEAQVNVAAEAQSESTGAAPSDMIPSKGGNNRVKQPNGMAKNPASGIKPGKLIGRPVAERKWRRGLGAH